MLVPSTDSGRNNPPESGFVFLRVLEWTFGSFRPADGATGRLRRPAAAGSRTPSGRAATKLGFFRFLAWPATKLGFFRFLAWLRTRVYLF